MGGGSKIRSVAVIGAGAAGAITAAALKAEEAFDVIRVFERRSSPGGAWIFDEAVKPDVLVRPGAEPPEVDPPLEVPENLPRVLPHDERERFSTTPVYSSLTTNVPDIVMCYSDSRFAYGPFVPHHVPRQYIENYFSIHKADSLLELNTTVEDLSVIDADDGAAPRWKLTLRKHDAVQNVDVWREEAFDAVILANGKNSVPSIPQVDGLEDYIGRFPGRVTHSKTYREAEIFAGKRVVVVGNSASGHDIVRAVAKTAKQPVYQSIRSKSIWDPDVPPKEIEYKPVITQYSPSGRITFADGTHADDVDAVIYCTGYAPSYPFWNARNNARPLWDYEERRLCGNYLHTFFHDFPTLGSVGIARSLTFRSFEYQAIALARVFAGRNALALPPTEEQARWERERAADFKLKRRNFHDVAWDGGETHEWLGALFDIAGLGTLTGKGRIPPPLTKEMVDVIEHHIDRPEAAFENAEVVSSSRRSHGDDKRKGGGFGLRFI